METHALVEKIRISIVIPTYSRPDQLSLVLSHLLASDVSGFEDVEIIVIDDGSPTPAQAVAEKIQTFEPIRLKYIYQENSGPAEARNNGFRNAGNEVVLFIDDDILVTPDLIAGHYRAHQERPGSVIYGSSPYAVPTTETPAYRYLLSLTEQYEKDVSANINIDHEYVPVEVVASGNLSVEKKLFGDRVYGDGLTIPVSEEFALALELRERNIPIYFARHISGWHLQPPTIRDSCIQNYKYGLGIAEVVAKMPEILKLEQIRNIYSHNTELRGLKGSVKSFSTPGPVRKSLLSGIELMEKASVPDKLLFPLFRFSVGNYFAAGIRDGLKRFGPAASRDQ